MLTLFTAAAVLAACACLRQLLNRPERTDAYFWKGRVRLTALWNDGAAFGLPLKRTLVTALSILILPLVWVFRRRSPIGAGLVDPGSGGILFESVAIYGSNSTGERWRRQDTAEYKAAEKVCRACKRNGRRGCGYI